MSNMAARYGPIEDELAAPVEDIRIPAIGEPSKYPGVQNDVPMLMARLARPGPDRAAMAVGIATKNDPFPAPLIAAKITRGAKVLLTGHIASMLMALANIVIASVFRAPILSHATPDNIRPIVVESPKPATRPAPVLGENPIELENSGMKNGGTNSAKVLAAPAKHRHRNGIFLSTKQSTPVAGPVDARSLSNNTDGIPVDSMRKPNMRKVHGRPSVVIISWAAIGRTVAPMPPPTLTSPFAVPSLLLNHCTGKLLLAVYNIDEPRPTSTPAVQKRPPML
ncbi:hypothetical protein PMZ80_011145 [Knufia obscura]|uniref:Uncharacterized protein n=1 Tax=Knufia obscura TaxID=1635080 RepID=A0ABR0R7L9_9EURO|nr:hypothetical protein PMZ80_011145 [Knufia obscura]